MPELTIRSMTRNEIDWAVDLAANEGWNPGLHDATAFHAQDPDGFLIGLLDGTPIGCISAINYEDIFGFVGFYIVLPDFRGQGYGMQLWRAAMERMQGLVVGLDGVFEQQENYRKSGFDFQYSNIRYEFLNTLQDKAPHEAGLTAATADMVQDITDYEAELFPCGRRTFLKHWLSLPDSLALVASAENGMSGYSVIRQCRTGYKIGPLFADDQQTAEKLFRSLCSSVSNQVPIYLDVPEINEPGMALAARYDMQRVFGTARMYAGAAPRLDVNRTFGVTTFELG